MSENIDDLSEEELEAKLLAKKKEKQKLLEEEQRVQRELEEKEKQKLLEKEKKAKAKAEKANLDKDGFEKVLSENEFHAKLSSLPVEQFNSKQVKAFIKRELEQTENDFARVWKDLNFILTPGASVLPDPDKNNDTFCDKCHVYIRGKGPKQDQIIVAHKEKKH